MRSDDSVSVEEKEQTLSVANHSAKKIEVKDRIEVKKDILEKEPEEEKGKCSVKKSLEEKFTVCKSPLPDDFKQYSFSELSDEQADVGQISESFEWDENEEQQLHNLQKESSFFEEVRVTGKENFMENSQKNSLPGISVQGEVFKQQIKKKNKAILSEKSNLYKTETKNGSKEEKGQIYRAPILDICDKLGIRNTSEMQDGDMLSSRAYSSVCSNLSISSFKDNDKIQKSDTGVFIKKDAASSSLVKKKKDSAFGIINVGVSEGLNQSHQKAKEEGIKFAKKQMQIAMFGASVATGPTGMVGNIAIRGGTAFIRRLKNTFKKFISSNVQKESSGNSMLALGSSICLVPVIALLLILLSAAGASEDSFSDLNNYSDSSSLEEERSQIYWQYLKNNYHLPDITIAALLGNIFQESSLNPKSGENDSHTGLVSWSNPGRFSQLQLKAGEQNRDYWSYDMQLDFMMLELKSANYKKVLSWCNKKCDYLEYQSKEKPGAVWYIAKHYEVCIDEKQKYGVQDYDNRLSAARRYYQWYSVNGLQTFSWCSRDKKNVESVGLTELTRYACRFIGKKYVWGGTSLTEGCDCSGYTMLVYRKFGVTLPHSSASQSKLGEKVKNLKEAQPGDLIFYAKKGKVNHVAIYLGNNLIVNASNSKAYPDGGIKTQPADYSPIYCIRRFSTVKSAK